MSLFTLLRSLVRKAGIDFVRFPPTEAAPTDLPIEFQSIISEARPFTLSSMHRLASTLDAVRYVVSNSIQGDIIECGVWRGGNMVVAARTLKVLGDECRGIYLYDTFEGMTPPANEDKDYAGVSAEAVLSLEEKGSGYWCVAGIDDVAENMRNTGYPMDRVHLVKGPVEQTIPATLPNKIALLRLDTDWYESTKHELEHLFPLLAPGGVLIIDDYGHWQGARQAVDEYFNAHRIKPMLARIDYTCRMFVKQR